MYSHVLAYVLLLAVSLVSATPRVLMLCAGSRSRVMPMAALARELREAGVHVTMALPAAASHWPEVNRTGAEIFPIDSGHDGGGGGGLEGYERAAEIREASASTFDGLIQRFSQAVGSWEYAEAIERDIWRSQALYEPVMTAYADPDDAPDLMIIDSYSFAGFDVAHQLGTPYAVYHPGFLDAPPFARAYVPAHGTGYSINMRPWERCINYLVPYLQHLALRPSLRSLNAMRAERRLKPVSFHFELWGAQNLFIATAAFGLEYARPLPSTVELVGPVQQVGSEACSSPDETADEAVAARSGRGGGGKGGLATESEVEEWLRFADEDVLLLSGLALLSSAQREALAEALKALKQPVLWTGAAARQLKARSPNFRKFAPLDGCHSRFLSHPAVSLVFSHCDVHEVHGAVLAGKASVCLPSTGTQLDAATRLADAGAAVVVGPVGRAWASAGSEARVEDEDATGAGNNRMPAEKLGAAVVRAVEEAMWHPTRARSSRAVRYLAHTMTSTANGGGGAKRAAHLIDTALALGMAHLRPLPMPWYSHTCLDLYCAFAALVVAFLLLLRLLAFLYSLLARVC